MNKQNIRHPEEHTLAVILMSVATKDLVFKIEILRYAQDDGEMSRMTEGL